MSVTVCKCLIGVEKQKKNKTMYKQFNARKPKFRVNFNVAKKNEIHNNN
jgi:hypothetical protein